MKMGELRELLETRHVLSGSTVPCIDAVQKDGTLLLSGNQAGIIQLADFILHIALSDGTHIHLDEGNFFDASNCECIIERIAE